jgi:hypothetical protein
MGQTRSMSGMLIASMLGIYILLVLLGNWLDRLEKGGVIIKVKDSISRNVLLPFFAQ